MITEFISKSISPVAAVGEITGSGKIWFTDTAPDGWFICDGSLISRTTYAALFAVIGTTFGAGDGSTTFALPNLKGRVVIGKDASQTEFDTLGETGGAKTHTLSTAEMPSHSHSISPSNRFVRTAGTDLDSPSVVPSAWSESTITIGNTGGGGAHNNLQPYLVLNFIIKY